MSSSLDFTYVVVDELPHGLAAARRLSDETDEVLTYVSRSAPLERVAAELAAIGNLHSDLYDRMLVETRHSAG
jgi:hypothetical protein